MKEETYVIINNKKYSKVTRVVGRKPDGKAIKKQFYASSKREAEEKAAKYLESIGLPKCRPKRGIVKESNVTIHNFRYFKITRVVGRKPDGTALKKQFYALSKREAEEKAAKYLDSVGLPFKNGRLKKGAEKK
ncbi:MAG: hypothetical protein LBT59_18795 [Clostridiales bacterium]|jgi:ABC-type oligopeptide transport system ATPase subunit|nr:hypothetical protein [Clostridiales bacterium]